MRTHKKKSVGRVVASLGRDNVLSVTRHGSSAMELDPRSSSQLCLCSDQQSNDAQGTFTPSFLDMATVAGLAGLKHTVYIKAGGRSCTTSGYLTPSTTHQPETSLRISRLDPTTTIARQRTQDPHLVLLSVSSPFFVLPLGAIVHPRPEKPSASYNQDIHVPSGYTHQNHKPGGHHGERQDGRSCCSANTQSKGREG